MGIGNDGAGIHGYQHVPFAQPKYSYREVEHDGTCTGHSGVLNAWADAILHGGQLVADGREGIHGLTLSNAMHLSAFLGKTVELPLDGDLYYEELMKRVKTSRRKTATAQVFADTSGSYGGSK